MAFFVLKFWFFSYNFNSCCRIKHNNERFNEEKKDVVWLYNVACSLLIHSNTWAGSSIIACMRNIQSIFLFIELHFYISVFWCCQLKCRSRFFIFPPYSEWQQLFHPCQFRTWQVWFHFEWSFEVAKLWL